MALLAEYAIDVDGARAVVIGRSDIVGKPVAHLLLQRHATVTICHTQTERLREVVGEAEILVAAAGQPGLIDGAWLRDGAVVIDFGVSVVDGKVRGDVEFESARAVASAITPVPGGTGPMTVAMLMRNTLWAARLRHRML
jgi:methylenetetrahydrofolate dehydrogenase (NADP+)/methenyltetrahydrofolate cyclohydrolase